MPEGLIGGPRPATTCKQSIRAEFNADLDSIDQRSIAKELRKSEAIVLRSSNINITEDVREIDGYSFEVLVVQIMLDNSDIMLASIENMVSDVEDIVGKRVTVNVEAV